MQNKSFFITISMFIFFKLTYGQYNKVTEYYIDFQNVVFKTTNSSYKFTRFTFQDRTFLFRQHFTDSSYSDTSFYQYFWPIKKESMKYKQRFKYIMGVDTIKSYIPIEQVEYGKDSLINIRDELNLSYVLRGVGEHIIINSKQSIIRFLYPCSNNNQCESYNLLEVKFYNDSAKLYTNSITTKASNVKIISKDSCLLSKKDVEKLKKEMNKVQSTQNMFCRKPGNPWLLEIFYENKYNYFIISDLCLHNTNGKWPIVHLPNLLLSLGTKHLGRYRFNFCKDDQIPISEGL